MSLETTNLAVGYNGHPILSNINVMVPTGAFAVLIGANGSGKSTFLRTLAGASKPIEGEVKINGIPISNLSPRHLAQKLAMVFTDRAGGGMLTVREAVEIGRYPYSGVWGRLSRADHSYVNEYLDVVGMKDKSDRYIGQLSDGERQKVMIAKALAQSTHHIVLDEPTSFLDVAGRVEILDCLARLRHNDYTILLSTHDVAPALERATHVLVVDSNCNTILSGSKEEMVASGAINLPFQKYGLKFDANINDFR